MNLEAYRASAIEKERTNDLLRLLPRGRQSVLDIGTRDGHFARLLTEYFKEVTALDLQKPAFEFPRVVTIAGDATDLAFPDNSFDCVFCAEVLEHIPDVERACRQIMRVARHEIIIGVPYRQDIRIGRATCQACGRINHPWGHVNSFDENRLLHLFSGCRLIEKSFVGSTNEHTNAIATLLMDLGGNPWGTYNQEEPCRCGALLSAPQDRSTLQKCCSAIAIRMNLVQARLTRRHGNWIHVALSKEL